MSALAGRWLPLALCESLLVAILAAPATSQAVDLPPSINTLKQCARPDAPLFSEVLSAASQPATPIPTSMPPATAAPTPSSQPPTPVPPTPTTPPATPAPVQRAVAAPTSLPLSPTPEAVRPVAPPPTPTSEPSPPPSPPSPSPGGCERIIALVNQARQENGLAPLTYNPLLADAAQRYADFLAGHNVLNHTADGRTLDARAEAAGYTTWVALGENLAGGYTSFEEALTAWLASPHHRDNIMNPAFRETGVGCTWNAASAYGSFFVQEFGLS